MQPAPLTSKLLKLQVSRNSAASCVHGSPNSPYTIAAVNRINGDFHQATSRVFIAAFNNPGIQKKPRDHSFSEKNAALPTMDAGARRQTTRRALLVMDVWAAGRGAERAELRDSSVPSKVAKASRQSHRDAVIASRHRPEDSHIDGGGDRVRRTIHQ